MVQHRNNLLPYYPIENTLWELTQLYSFTGLKIVHNNSHDNQNQTNVINWFNNDNNRGLEINHGKITKPSFHNVK